MGAGAVSNAWGASWGTSWGASWGSGAIGRPLGGIDIRPTRPDPRTLRRIQDDRDLSEIMTIIFATGLLDEAG